MKKLNLVGERFGKLKVIKSCGKTKSGSFKWECICDCGNISIIAGGHLRSGHTSSCGCFAIKLLKKRSITHGATGTNLLNVFFTMKARCNNAKHQMFPNYGGRGIKCLWDSFEEFRDDMYKSYTQHIKKFGRENTSIDRIDNNGNYCKENCKWSTYKEQGRNRRTNKLITFEGKTKCVSEWTEELNFPYFLIYKRLRKGWSVEKALTQPVETR